MKLSEKPILFVGAGPGDPELLTLKGKKALEEAGLVLYAGSLVNAGLLDFCSPGCERADSSGMSLEEQVSLMANAAGRECPWCASTRGTRASSAPWRNRSASWRDRAFP
jgi:precorrin-4/cobalt-precorrin-4 C11-methyltransferase